MRVSDLHLKVGCPPVYRVDGALQKMKGNPLDAPTLAALARAVLADGEWQVLQSKSSVDGSYITDTMQFRLNCFNENDGLALAIRALDSNPPAVEDIGFPNGVWRDIVAHQHGLRRPMTIIQTCGHSASDTCARANSAPSAAAATNSSVSLAAPNMARIFQHNRE